MWLAAVRDVAIVLLALESLVIGVLLAVLLIQLRGLVRLLREEIAPMINSASDTVNTVHGTVDFVSEHLVSPVIKVSSYATGARRVLGNLLFIGRRMRNSASRPDRGGEVID
ncbi:MAG TPA: hypothetical protein GX702_15875 [Chloroflexi bacterium]|nr:hypothetical protein [Chloroflexota bacterium]